MPKDLHKKEMGLSALIAICCLFIDPVLIKEVHNLKEPFLSIEYVVQCDNDYKASRCLKGKQLVWQKKEIEEWTVAIQKAVEMLPGGLLEKLNQINVTFLINRNDWATASVADKIYINLLPKTDKLPSWMTWEPYGANGFLESEKVFIAFHEIGHLYGGINLLAALEDREGPVTKYTREMGQEEDGAETFALYFLWPEYLKNFYPIHYEVIKNIIEAEYTTVYPMPNSITSRLLRGVER